MSDNLLQQFSALIDDPSAPIPQELVDEMATRYPSFTLPASMMLARDKESNTLDAETRQSLINRLALNSPDRDTLYSLISPDGNRFADFYPDQEKTEPISTNDAIATFIDNYGTQDPNEDALLERLIFNPTPDYAQLLAQEEEKSVPDLAEAQENSQDALINAFIIKSREQAGGHFPSASDEPPAEPANPIADDHTPVNAPELTDDSLLSESLAKIYIKQRRYSKAYEIISNLSLNYPEKSIYFADQLRFLRKLIINQQYKQTSNK